jgi:hypothetical protein
MCKSSQLFTIFTIGLLILPGVARPVKRNPSGKEVVAEITGQGPAVLWRYPSDIATRNLYYGPGGRERQPRGAFTFLKEDLHGSNPKFDVVDEHGVKWGVKMGLEARPETVASRIVWAAGYFTNEDYFVPVLRVRNMQPLRRGQKYVAPGGIVYNVRLKRHDKEEKKIGDWQWADDPFAGTREWNGLRVLMAVINNWDLKDENNHIYQVRTPRGPEQIYTVSDLGASFGNIGLSWTLRHSKSNLRVYEHTHLIRHLKPEYVDFYVPSRPALDHFPTVHELQLRRGLEWIGQKIPRTDARWMGDLLSKLKPAQIQDAFRAAGYSQEEIEGFTQELEKRIQELHSL